MELEDGETQLVTAPMSRRINKAIEARCTRNGNMGDA